MTKLSPTAIRVLTEAANSEDFLARAIPKMPPAAMASVFRSLLKNGLLEEAAPECLRITDAGFLAIGIERPAPVAPAAEKGKRARKAKTSATMHGSKQNLMLDMLRSGGATAAQIGSALGWELHTVRGLISILKSKGVAIQAERAKEPGAKTIYSLARD